MSNNDGYVVHFKDKSGRTGRLTRDMATSKEAKSYLENYAKVNPGTEFTIKGPVPDGWKVK